MLLEYLVILLPVSYALKCLDKTIGTANGNTFNYANTLRCPDRVNWCMNLNGSFALTGYSIDGIVGNCETNGFVGAFVSKMKESLNVDISCKEIGWRDFPQVNLTQYCCNTDMCNTISGKIVPLSLLLLIAIHL